MQLTVVLTNAYRQAVLKDSGRVLEKENTLPIPLEALSPMTRALIAQENPKLQSSMKLQLPVVGKPAYVGSENWESSLLPTTPSEWDQLFSEFAQAKLVREQEISAAYQENLNEMLMELREALAKPDEQLYFSPTYRLDDRHKECTGYDEAVALIKQVKLRKEAYEAAQKQQRLKLEQQQQEAKEKQKREKAEWIAAHGSASLQRKFLGGYECQRQYVEERASQEFPDYIVDYGDKASWGKKHGPSDEAFAEAQRVGGTVVHLKEFPYADVITSLPTEAVVVEGYLGQYDLVRVI